MWTCGTDKGSHRAQMNLQQVPVKLWINYLSHVYDKKLDRRCFSIIANKSNILFTRCCVFQIWVFVFISYVISMIEKKYQNPNDPHELCLKMFKNLYRIYNWDAFWLIDYFWVSTVSYIFANTWYRRNSWQSCSFEERMCRHIINCFF